MVNARNVVNINNEIFFIKLSHYKIKQLNILCHNKINYYLKIYNLYIFIFRKF